MRFIGQNGIVMAAAVAATLLGTSPPVGAQAFCGASVVVAPGETLSAIGRRCGVSVAALLAANPRLRNPYLIVPGMRLDMPGRAAPPPMPINTTRYVVRYGDTLSSIARANGLTLTDIYRLNPNIDGSTLRVGDIVILPGAAPPPSVTVVRYTVRFGDTLSSIARAYGLTLTDIYRLNPNIDAGALRVGDIVRLPAGVASPPPDTNTARYTVRFGDTLYSIARANRTTTSEILRLNPGLDANRLRVGDIILVRGGFVPPEPIPTTRSVTITPSSAAPGAVIQLSAAGFRPSSQLRLLVGRDGATVREFQQLVADPRGQATLRLRVPSWAAEGSGTLVFVVETLDGGQRARSGLFRATSAEPEPAPAPSGNRISVVGTLTREGAECPAMRGDDGRLYTLPRGTSDGFEPGDRVRVQGRVATISTCQQGTTIDVLRIESVE